MRRGHPWTPQVWRYLVGLLLVGFLLRFYLVNEPAEVVFDEVHFGGFASSYLRREYFFDVHPPLGKLMIAAMGYLFGYDGSFTFGSIGTSYGGTSVPYVALRTFMVALCLGSIAFSYATMVEMGFSVYSCVLAAGLLVFDNALTVQSRLILLDSPLMFFISAAVYFWVKFRQMRHKPFKRDWWAWLCLTGVAIGCATSVKMVGLLTVLMVGSATVWDLWELADQKNKLSEWMVRKHFLCRALGLIVVPISIYLGSYYIHFAVLNRSGPGDSHMSPQFQSTLKGNMMDLQSRNIYYGHTIRIKNRIEDVFLHSHQHNYPLHHIDGKVSSQGQQVTGYPGEDPNNLWRILPADTLDVSPSSRRIIKPGDHVRLMHVSSKKVLMTHDVASALTKTNMEMTVVDPETTDKPIEFTLWQFEFTNTPKMLALATNFRIFNVAHKVFVTNWQQPLPKWGFGQREINGDRRGSDKNSRWLISEVLEPIDPVEQKEIASRPKVKLSFMDKYLELQATQIRSNAHLIDKHPYKSDPISWPFVLRGVSYWDKGKDSRVYFLGNPIAWYIAILGTVGLAVVAGKLLYRHHRGYTPTQAELKYESRYICKAGYLLLAWGLHYFPFFCMARTLYLHHYLPAYTLSAMAAAATFDHLTRGRLQRIHRPVVLLTLIAVALAFLYLAPITYGTTIPTKVLNRRKLVSTWDWP